MAGDKPKICVILGPTATGKSLLAVWLAKKIGGEIVSCDSMSVYKKMDIATAKLSRAEQEDIVHHMIGFLDIFKEFSVAEYVKMAKENILQILSKNKKVILVGGSGFYIDSLICGRNFEKEDKNKNIFIRGELFKKAEKMGIKYLYKKLEKIDPTYAKTVHINNKKRIIRAIEKFILTGKNLTQNLKLHSSEKEPFKCLKIGLNFKDRNRLYENIDIRVDKMLKQGLLQEARYILYSNCSKTARQAIGYKEFAPYFNGTLSLKDAILNLKRDSKRYAKRQLTWFRKDREIKWFFVDQKKKQDIEYEVLNLVREFF